ncbi:DUF3035 domain-containing protein [Paracraurococcus lichenis]|uniref:DUF3035 domain-containing protein n=1 Tax=Paracraurococcus lichenis TaxID=3064888 RepID=A0ABT9E8Y0_9PROT|nr:DUF3035 domain-containing protein [Paracraurococcus sp. LOR1-02]MDO9712644.1 DUF3035 domain-containing protein [Paracraurococcus sp. LOR1-02]
MSPRRPLPAAIPVALGLLALGLLAGCGPDTARTFGFTRDAPDEFQVTTRAPLSMPPSLGELPVPRPGANRPQEMSARLAAETTLVPGAALGTPAQGRQSSGESALLSQAGRPTGPDIRRRVDEESLKLDQADRGLTDRLIFWRAPEPPGIALDAKRESQRLRENAALGREATEGETPIIQRSQSGNPVTRLFESIF